MRRRKHQSLLTHPWPRHITVLASAACYWALNSNLCYRLSAAIVEGWMVNSITGSLNCLS